MRTLRQDFCSFRLHINQLDNRGQAMTDAPDNPAAFPRTCDHFDHKQEGMSLRDWFAGRAFRSSDGILMLHPDEAAEAAYQYADAMLAARKAKP